MQCLPDVQVETASLSKSVEVQVTPRPHVKFFMLFHCSKMFKVLASGTVIKAKNRYIKTNLSYAIYAELRGKESQKSVVSSRAFDDFDPHDQIITNLYTYISFRHVETSGQHFIAFSVSSPRARMKMPASKATTLQIAGGQLGMGLTRMHKLCNCRRQIKLDAWSTSIYVCKIMIDYA